MLSPPPRTRARIAALDDQPTPRWRARLSRRQVLAGSAALLVVWAAATTLLAVDARGDLLQGRDIAEEVEDLSTADLLEGRAAPHLRQAEASFGSGASTLANPLFLPLAPVPVLGRQVRTARDLGEAAEALAEAGARLSATAAEHRGAATGPERLAAVQAVTAALERFALTIQGVAVGPGDGLVDSLAEARQDLLDLLVDLRETIGDARAAVGALGQILRGPTDLLLLAANTAEMRAGHGALLQWGVLHGEGGEVGVPAGMSPIRTFPKPVSPPPTDPALSTGWEWLDLSIVANLGTTPRWNVTADRVLDLYHAATGTRPAGVLLVDSVALADLIELLGRPFTSATGERVAPDDALRHLLHDQYEGIPLDGLFQVNKERRDGLADLAAEVMDGLLEAPIASLADVLGDLGADRHLMAYSDDDALQGGWRALGLTGELGPQDMAVSLFNAGQNKLDQYIETHVDVTSEDAGDDRAAVMVTLRARNTTPPDDLPYVMGFRPDDLPDDAYTSIVIFTLPPGVGTPEIDGHSSYIVNTSGPLGTTLAIRFDLVPGDARAVRARFTVPRGTTLQLLPSSRSPATSVSIAERTLDPAPGSIAIQL